MSDLTRKIVDFSYDGQATEAREAFYAALYDKVMAHLEAQKQSIASGLLNTEEVESIDEMDRNDFPQPTRNGPDPEYDRKVKEYEKRIAQRNAKAPQMGSKEFDKYLKNRNHYGEEVEQIDERKGEMTAKIRKLAADRAAGTAPPAQKPKSMLSKIFNREELELENEIL